MGIKYCITPRGNLSRTSNIGISYASYDKVIITDSDTTFEPGAIAELYHSLCQFPIARARIRFILDKKRTSTRIVSEARDYVNSLPLVYTPGVAFHKEVAEKLGGFLFNDLVPYAVDADWNYRIARAKVPVKFDGNAMINHCPEGVRHDLKAAYRIGCGCAISYMSLRKNSKFSTMRWNDLKGVKISMLPDVLSKKGAMVLLYQIVWDSFYWMGYAYQRVRGI
jgi:glycosyltransferase involved in cell wall biosynthesis